MSVHGDAQIVFGNLIPGLVDAPIRDLDGTLLSNPAFVAQLYVDMAPFEDSGPQSLLAVSGLPPVVNGYFDAAVVDLLGFEPGQKVWVVVRVQQNLPSMWEGEPQTVLWGESDPVSVELRDTPVLLEGLRGFRLNYQDAWITREANHIKVWWCSLGVHYRVLTASSPSASSWDVVFSGPSEERYSLMSVLLPAHSSQLFVRLEVTRFHD